MDIVLIVENYMPKAVSSNSLDNKELDKLFCLSGKKYSLPKLFIKSIALCESSLDERAYRMEMGFWNQYLKGTPEWGHRDPAEVSASYGLMQLMYTTAHGLGFDGPGEDLYNPVINIELGAKLLRTLLNRVLDLDIIIKFPWLPPLQVVLARYNGGSKGNPDDAGNLRNIKYVRRVWATWDELKVKEKECEDDE